MKSISVAQNLALLAIVGLISVAGCSKSPSSPPSIETPQTTGVTQNLTKRAGGPLWNIESVGPVNEAWKYNSFEVPAHGKIVVLGWAVDQEAKAPAGGVEIAVDGTPYSAQYGTSRPDVAQAYSQTAYVNSGYSLNLVADTLAPGAHTAFVHVITNDRKGFWEVGPYTLNVR